MKDSRLKRIFDLSYINILTNSNAEEYKKSGPETNKKISELETQDFDEIVKGLEEDFKETGLNLTFSSKIIINEVAMNMILLDKILLQSTLFRVVNQVYKDIVLLKKSPLYKEYSPQNTYWDLHPFFEKMIFKLQKQISEGLKQLGLLPVQQIERQKLTIIKTLRQKYENKYESRECTIESKQERKVPSKEINQENPPLPNCN